MFRNLVLLLAVHFITSNAAFAGQTVEDVFPLASASYLAQNNTTYTGQSYTYRVNSSIDKVRTEYEIELRNGKKIPAVVISRIDKKLTWTLQPDQKTYVTMKNKNRMPTANLQTDGWINVYVFDNVEQSAAGEDDVNGIKAAKYKVAMSNAHGTKLSGFVWRTNEKITVKVDVTETGPEGDRRLQRELKGLKIVATDPALFEIPKGYIEKMSGFAK
jgi:hypothetical protein